MCPKRSFGVILETTQLNKSKAYGYDHGNISHRAQLDCSRVVDDFQVPGVVGYTGYREAQPITEKPVVRETNFMRLLPPGYTGFVPAAKAQSLFGRSYSVIATACAKRVHDS